MGDKNELSVGESETLSCLGNVAQEVGKTTKSSRRLDSSRGMEDKGRMENKAGKEKELWEAWRNLRKLRNEISEKETCWQVLNTKESWKIKAEGRKLRVDVAHSKKKRFGKICKKGLTDLEDKLMKSLLDIREVE